jgi:chaperone protein EcpD
MRSSKLHVIAAAFICSVMAFAVQAGVVITGTRVVYPEQSREVNVRLTNADTKPILVQTWIDDGDAMAKPDQIRVPFVLLPAVFRLDPTKGQSLRIMYAGSDDLPKDRESVYWLNVLEIPPKAENADGRNVIQIAFRTRIKMFYRPTSLQSDPAEMRSQLKWHVAPGKDGKRVLRLENPSPYYVSLAKVSLAEAGKTIELKPDMAPPFGSVDLEPEKGPLDLAGPATISFEVLNDYGAAVKDTAQLVGEAEGTPAR